MAESEHDLVLRVSSPPPFWRRPRCSRTFEISNSLPRSKFVPVTVEKDISVCDINKINTTSCDPPPLPLRFIPGEWYRRPKICHPEGVCFYHLRICEKVELNVLLSKSLPPDELEDEFRKFYSKCNERMKKMERNQCPLQVETVEESEKMETDEESEKMENKTDVVFDLNEELEEGETKKKMEKLEKKEIDEIPDEQEIEGLQKEEIVEIQETEAKTNEEELEKEIETAEESEKEKKTAEEELQSKELEETKNNTEEDEGNTSWTKIMQLPWWTIKRDENYNISELLSSQKRDYLVNYKGDQVKIKDLSLSSKYVLLFFTYLPSKDNTYNFKFDDVDMIKCYSNYIESLQCKNFANRNHSLILDLKETYTTHHPKEQFEIVFVALGSNEDAFRDCFSCLFRDSDSCLPVLAIPHDDQDARDSLEDRFAIPPEPTKGTAILFNKEGRVVLGEDSWFKITCFGSLGFPFTEDWLDDMHRDEGTLFDELIINKNKFYLTSLLGDHVIAPGGNKVRTTSAFEGKIVGLYLFEKSPLGFRQASELLNIWRRLKHKMDKEIEIVFIYKAELHISIAKAAFEKEFGNFIPWYSLLPNGAGRRVCRVLSRAQRWDDCSFIILNPDKYHSLSFFALDIFKKFGYDAYPFTVGKIVDLTRSKQQITRVLPKLLSLLAPLCRGGPAGYKERTIVSKLLGKRVILLFATHFSYESGSFLSEMIQLYRQKKDDDFEIIYIWLGCEESKSTFSEIIEEMPPWLVHSFVQDFGVKLARKVFDEFGPKLPAIAAFERDGSLVARETNLALKKGCQPRFPFIQADLGEEIHRVLIEKHQWQFERQIPDDYY